ncbi:MAG: hypothetical protein Q7J68_03155 [Thermoplasmata archaeon]|nr:hypothetical protein [Thermoplasmata archaeon]
MKKPRFRRFGIGTGTKVQQANLRALAKRMAKDPGILIPECVGQCSRCPFDKLLLKLRKIQSFSKNSAVLKKYASGGKALERGYAAMLMLANEETPIMFAEAHLPTGDVNYTVRGKAKKEVLIGLQHFDDPKLRLLAYAELAHKLRVHLYSLGKGLVCSGASPKYPGELISEILRASNYNLKKGQSCFKCDHADEGYGFDIEIISAGQTISVCKSCALRKQNLFTELTSRVLARHPDEDFSIHLEHDIECHKGDGCTLSGKIPGTSNILARYKSGGISDEELVEEYGAAVKASVENSGKVIFVLGNICYENDYEAFIKALNPTEIEGLALKRMLKNAPTPILMETATPNAVLTLFWDTLGANSIYAVIGDKELAKKIFLETRDSGKQPTQILRDAKIQSKSKNVLGALPDFKNLSRVGKYVDDVARTYKALGKEEMLKRISTGQGDTVMKNINCGFLNALGALKGKEWQFTKEEQDYGNYLTDFATALLESEPEEYTDALQNLLTASASGETVQ